VIVYKESGRNKNPWGKIQGAYLSVSSHIGMNGAHNFIMIYIEGVIAKKPTLVLVNLGTHNLMFEVFVINLGHPIGIVDPSKILLPNGQVHSTNLFMKVLLV